MASRLLQTWSDPMCASPLQLQRCSYREEEGLQLGDGETVSYPLIPASSNVTKRELSGKHISAARLVLQVLLRQG